MHESGPILVKNLGSLNPKSLPNPLIQNIPIEKLFLDVTNVQLAPSLLPSRVDSITGQIHDCTKVNVNDSITCPNLDCTTKTI